MARVVPKELKWMVLAGSVYVFFCGMLFFSSVPQTSIEPVDLKVQGLLHIGGRGPKEAGAADQQGLLGGGGGLNSMMSLLHSPMFSEQGVKLKWIKERVARMSHSWEEAQQSVATEKSFLFTNRKKILLFPGLLSEYSAYDFANNAFKGGYLGELVQWSDLISTLHMLGHYIVVLTTTQQLLERVPLDKSEYDFVFTDYIGLFGLRDSQHYYLYKCKIRVLDSFGTEPLYNFRTMEFQADERLTMFDNWNFEEPRQFWTMFPHTPDNSFLGIVVEPPDVDLLNETKKPQGVIYGKEAWYAFGRENYLNTIGEVVELHATFKEAGDSLPTHIVNHGILPAEELQKLLRQSKIFVGLGFPYDGPGPFEALANGCVFIQPLFNPPHNHKNTQFLDGKPTTRSLTSQVSYLEHFVGEPYVYTVDISNSSAVKEAVYKILRSKDMGQFIPHEFTQKGMLERVGAYLSHQNFCDGADLALGRPATASSSFKEHAPGEAVDGLLTKDTCYWSAPDDSHWWMVDLGEDYSLHKIRITNTFEWLLAKNWNQVFLNPFTVSLTNSHGSHVATKTFTDWRTFYLWEDINLRARFVRLDSLDYPTPRYFVLCAVEVFGSSSRHPIWPDLTTLLVHKARAGVSCKEACMAKGIVCEPAHFRMLNKLNVLRHEFNCSASKAVSTEYVDFLPAWSVEDDTALGVGKGTCVTNENTLLLSCAGHDDKYQRLCPCRRYVKGQIAIPLPV